MTMPYDPHADWAIEDNALAYLVGTNPISGETDPNWFTPVAIKSVGTRDDGTRYADYVTRTGRTGFGARANLDQFVPASAVKRVNVNGRRRLIWR